MSNKDFENLKNYINDKQNKKDPTTKGIVAGVLAGISILSATGCDKNRQNPTTTIPTTPATQATTEEQIPTEETTTVPSTTEIEVPTTEAPTTEAPTTEAPTTERPTEPTTKKPYIPEPTRKPYIPDTTKKPYIPEPTTEKPSRTWQDWGNEDFDDPYIPPMFPDF